MGYARIQRERFDANAVLEALRGPRVGGVNLYVGTVREEDAAGRVAALEYDAYPEMAQTQLERLRVETVARFSLVDAIVIHRIGRIAAGDPILLVALAASHRRETFAAIEYFMDRLKAIVPIWKQEIGAAGSTWILGHERVKT